ncbi:hypothetical protein ACE6H2_002567 [Prunus campanulata]
MKGSGKHITIKLFSGRYTQSRKPTPSWFTNWSWADVDTLGILVYGAAAGRVDEIARMGKSTILESFVRFYEAIKTLYTRDYLRKLTARDLQRLLQKAEARGFPGVIGSIDCMHWQWKNCPTA